MCGICGIVDRDPASRVDVSVVKQMTLALRHRGPDELAVYASEGVGLGHARLSIVDLSGGGQPMANEDQTLWITFNGEIYNHLELRPELERAGHRFETHCDTEVILHAYEEWGTACVGRFNGQFAFAIWDSYRRTLFMARDHLGVRPLYYMEDGRRLLFASEVKSIFAANGARPRIDPAGLDEVFTFWSVIAPRTVFENVRQLPPGHHLVATEQGLKIEKFWDLDFSVEEGPAEAEPEDYYAEGLRNELIRATRLRLRADVPVAAYLSGGLDSSFTTAIAKEYTGAPLTTFSIRFADADFDEGDEQNAMVAHLGVDHRSTMVTRSGIATGFPQAVWHAETPILRTAPVPLYHLAHMVRENGVKVVITGEGADEMLGGYNIFKEAKIRRFWAREPDSPFRPLLLSRLYPYIRRADTGMGAFNWQRFFATGLTDTDDPCYSHRIRWNNTAAIKRFFSPELRAQIGARDSAELFRESLPSAFTEWSPLAQAQYIEVRTFMTPYLLSSQGDRVSMAHAVEGRFPFLDPGLVRFAARIPSKYRLRGLQEKHVLRRAASGFLPDPIRRRPKQPYRAPDSVSFREPQVQDMVREFLSEKALDEAGYFDTRMAVRFLEQHRMSDPDRIGARDDMTFLGILSTQLLHGQFVKGMCSRGTLDDSKVLVRTKKSV